MWEKTKPITPAVCAFSIITMISRSRIMRNKIIAVLLSALGLSACVSTAVAPLGRDPSLTGNQHVVRKGETVYAIAMRYGLDYRQLVEWNDIEERFLIYPGQKLRLSATASNLGTDDAPSSPGRLEIQKMPDQAAKTPQRIVILQKPSPAPEASPSPKTSSSGAPKPPKTPPTSKPAARSGKRDATEKKKAASPPKEKSARKRRGTGKWRWPSDGKLIRNFAQSGRRGWDISDRFGAPVYATATGRVVYTGSGLRGYGKLIIIKHNAQYLSAYGSNDRMLVKEGDKVKAGQKIAEMGKDNTNQAMLHFEIRKAGKPVDPLRYLGR